MLLITVPAKELWAEDTGLFINVKEQVLSLEHSLVSISKWEAKWHKPFIGKEQKTNEEIIDYIKCMTTTQNVDNVVYRCLSEENIKKVNEYIENPMTATWFTERKDIPKPPQSKEQITSELIYYWMIALEIPFECQRWHLNRLLTLIRICNIKNKPPKKYGKQETLKNNAALNAARREKLGTAG